MKFLGIDYGEKRVGLAVSDDGGVLAFPHSVLENDVNLVSNISEIINKEEISQIVVGESTDFSGKPNPVMEGINNFVEKLKTKTLAKIIFEPEFLTSVEAEKLAPKFSEARGEVSRIQKRNVKTQPTDASSATIILQSYLDRGGE